MEPSLFLTVIVGNETNDYKRAAVASLVFWLTVT